MRKTSPTLQPVLTDHHIASTALAPGYTGKWQRRVRPAGGASCEALASRARAPRSGAPHGAPSLEDVTLDPHALVAPLPDVADGAGHPEQLTCKVIVYSDGVRASVYRARQKRAASGFAPDADGSSDQQGSTLTDSERSEASIRRSRALVVHRVRCLGAYALWTFTKRGKFASADECWAAWRAFCQNFMRRFKRKCKYVVVPELHADGETWHLHAVFPERFDVVALRILWQRALGGRGNERGEHTLGNVDVKALRGRGATARGIAGYVAKYVGKGFERSSTNRRVFASSSGLHPNRTAYWRCPWDAGFVEFVDFVGRRLLLDFGVERIFPRYYFKPKFQWALIDAPIVA